MGIVEVNIIKMMLYTISMIGVHRGYCGSELIMESLVERNLLDVSIKKLVFHTFNFS